MRLLIIALLLLSLSLPSQTLETFASGQDGLVAYYSFDTGTAEDMSGLSNSGTIHNAQPTKGAIGEGMYFNGQDAYIQVPHSNSLDIQNAFTITGWVRVEDPII